jgi:hypothetical protein
MKQEKWDKLHKELDDALDSEFGKAKLALRKYISDNKEKVTKDLEQMRELSNRDKQEPLEEVAANLADPNLCKTDNWIEGAKWMQEQMEKLKDFDTWKEWKSSGIIKSE